MIQEPNETRTNLFE